MERTQAVILVSAFLILGFVLNLVRLRRLREEYSWLWLAATSFYLLMALIPKLVNKITIALGITSPVTALLFFGLFFIVLILIHYSVKLTMLDNQMKDVAQQIAILDGEQYKINQILNNLSITAPSNNMQSNPDQKQLSREKVDILES